MKKFLIGLSILFSVGLITAAKPASADGGIFYPVNYYTAETAQKAFIYYAGQTENLVVLARFKGTAKDFAWVIPTPSKPEVNLANVDLFNSLADATQTGKNTPVVYSAALPSLGANFKTTPVEVISEKTIGLFDTAVLKATDENSLTKWLSDHGYTFPKDRTADLKSYVDRGWYFSVAKINPANLSADTTTKLAKGTLTPLRLTFESDKIIYPMKLTGLALTQGTPPSIQIPTNDNSTAYEPFDNTSIPVTLYVLSDHRVEHKLLMTKWSNWVNKDAVKSLNENFYSDIIPSKKLFLTKMESTVAVTDIDDDFIITNSSDNSIYPTPDYKTADFWLTELLFLIIVPLAVTFFPIPLGLFFIIFTILQVFGKRKWLYTVGIVYQILVCLVPLAIILIILSQGNFDLTTLWQESGFIGDMLGLLIVDLGLIYSVAKIITRYKKHLSSN